MTASVLFVDDDAELCEAVRFGLAPHGIDIAARTRARDALADLAARDFTCVVTDLQMPEMDGFELMSRISACRPDLPVIVLTARGDFATAVAAIRAGAYDFCTKPVDLAQVVLAVQRASERRQLRAEVVRLERVVAEARRFETLVGASAAMQEVYERIALVADTEATVLITGESGTGKDMAARAIHARSRRNHAPFVAIDCAAISESLIEAELFGHERGAFTDARTARQGLFAQADGGTVFLDEIAELPLATQPKLLRALQDRRVRPIGGGAEVAFDVRVIAATHRDLPALVADGAFREDLYYRLDVVELVMPPLRARPGDAVMLAQNFLEHFARLAGRDVRHLSVEAAQKIRGYAWPGNVRELRNAIERAVALAEKSAITGGDLPDRVRAHRFAAPVEPRRVDMTLEDVERTHILAVLAAHDGNKVAASSALGIDRKTLYRKLQRYGIDRDT